jgi:hypothetical protein
MPESASPILCLRCGYDLRSTPPDSPCPECGLAAHRSVIDHVHLDDCRPGWVWSISVATILLLISYVLALGEIIYLVWVSFNSDVDTSSPVALVTLLLATTIIHLVANWILSRDDRPRPAKLRGKLLRWALRILPIGPVACWIFLAVSIWKTNEMPNWLLNWANVICYTLLAPILVCPTLTFFRLRWLAIRLSRPRLAEHIGIVATGSAFTFIAAALCTAFALHLVRHADALFFFGVVLPWSLVGLFMLWSLLLLFVIANRFHRSARQAAKIWKSADAAAPPA